MLCCTISIFSYTAFSQPANDDCTNASIVNISSAGFGLGVFTSSNFDLTSATLQPGETFAPAIFVASQNRKSIWYKFTLPTTRTVRVTLAQPGSLITAGDAGFAVYKTNSCLPTGAEISTKLTPIGVFGNSFHPCVENGEYLVQVSSKAAANGPVYITVETGQPTAAFDLPAQAYYFGIVPRGLSIQPDYTVECQTIEDATEVCNNLANYQDYTKSTWHVFTTPAYIDYLAMIISANAVGKIGFKIYEGDVRSSPFGSLPLVRSCDSMFLTADAKVFKCGVFNPNKTYSIQFFYHKSYIAQFSLRLAVGGFGPTIAPEPILSAITPTTNNLGVLPFSPAGVLTQRNDYLGCNSRHSIHPCSPSLPAGGVLYGGLTYNLSTFFTFTLSGTSNVGINIGNQNPAGSCGPALFVQLYNQGLTNNCGDLNSSNIIGQFITSSSLSCLPAGNYTMQILGQDTAMGDGYACYRGNLGTIIDMNISVRSIQAINQFSLSATGAFDTLNRVAGIMQPLTPGVTYTSKVDTFGCANTVMPADPNCNPADTKVMYREFIVTDSGIVSLWTSGSMNLNYKIFKGDANSLAIAQNSFSYPGTITGLIPQTLCISNTIGPPLVCDGSKVCVEPGTYTEAVYGGPGQIGQTNQFQVRFNVVNTTHHNLATAEDLGDILSIVPPTGGSVTSSIDYFSCKDNAIVIDGVQPCKDPYNVITATKAIYRQFYISSPANITVTSQSVNCGIAPLTLFKGKATDGLAALTAMPAAWRCFEDRGAGVCNPLSAGWYTVVSYGWGPSYQDPTRNVNSLTNGYFQYGGWVGYANKIQITYTVSTCPLPKYNRPNKAAIDTATNQPFLIQWVNRFGSTPAYPKTDTTYNLYPENFLCPDTPFAAHPVLPCSTEPNYSRVAYYVFQLTQESFLKITSSGTALVSDYGIRISVYAGNVRVNPNLLINTSPIQPCIIPALGQLQLCNMQPGYYTLVIYAHTDMSCRTTIPSIYIDKMGYSRFDHANNAYDFGLIPSDSIWHNGKPGDVNPLEPGRSPSNDFFYCTTGSQPNDPAYGCNSSYLPSIYSPGNNNPTFTSNALSYGYIPQTPRRNLWYTFTVDKGGWVRVKVKNKTNGKGYQYPYFVAKSDVNGTLPFSTVVSSGAVDSTAAMGLNVFTGNAISGQTCSGGEEVSFYRDPCSPITERYYIIVQNSVADPEMIPNHQVEVSVLFDSVNAIQPKFDHYYQANNIGTNLGPGIFSGATDNYSCATKDATDPMPNGNCTKNLWYKFSTTVSGNIKFRMYNVTGGYYEIGPSRFQLFRQIIPGDSTSNGLQHIQGTGLNDGSGANGYYFTECIAPGTYYIILPNCDALGGEVYPEITITEIAGDYCSKPVIAALNGAGSSVSSVQVNCHTIGTDYGEFNPTLTCPAGAITNQYKTSWFKINITGADTLDVTTYLTNSTSVASTQIKYRLMNGDCNAMQERSCVQDALTQDTYKCLAPGDYWVQVFTPIVVGSNQVTGTIDLHLSAINHVDTCAPVNQCLSNANFQMQFDCTADEAVRFINYSTYGASVSYLWNFGYNSQTSSAVSPQFIYPSLATSQKYYISLTVTNNSCGGFSTYMDSIIIPTRPVVYLGADTSLCNGGSVVLNATSFSGAIYQWNTGATTPSITVSASGQNDYSVAVTYNGCIARDTLRVNIDPLTPQKLSKYACGNDPVVLNSIRGFGESFIWNTGAISTSINVFNPSTYWVDINLRGCITRDSFIVSSTANSLGNDRQVCFGTQPVVLNATAPGAVAYTWQNGSTASTFTAPTAGLYWVDISFGNCILRDTIVLSNYQPLTGNLSGAICQGQSYTLPSGKIVNTAGTYSDTLRTTQGCDSVINSVILTVQNVTAININAVICSGQTYTLPWGNIVSAAGVYKDTLHYISGCDSVRRTVNLSVQSPAVANINAIICEGQTFTLPWGNIVSAAGVYKDTLRYSSTGCDSLYRTINLSVQLPQTSPVINATVCSGQTYMLPWGNTVSTAGVYKDTLHFTTGCDSLYRTVNLSVQLSQSFIITDTICAGQTYTLPWGTIVSVTGVYRDTLRYSITGCDSLYRIVNLTALSSALTTNTNAVICAGQSYTLPWGNIVSSTGIYKDTLHYTTGCDSLYRIVNLTVQASSSSIINPVICEGQSYTLPWGSSVSASGTYKDTLHYTTGCDSLYRTVNLTVQAIFSSTFNPVICAGQSYTLPSGNIVSSSGIYKDTLRYTTGCDSLYRTVNLTVQATSSSTINPVICAGQTYTLPWGSIVSLSGIYKDTLRYTTGCDSLYRTVNLTVQTTSSSIINQIICVGQTYTLPWGNIVSASGTYKDTLRYTTGCDSLYRTVNLTVKTTTSSTINPVICAGQSYTLPWGNVVSITGVYRDTLRYSITGCDSLYRIVNLTALSSALTSNTNVVICSGQTYTLPWGTVVNISGIYKDTLRYTTGCDSLYRKVNLTVQSSSSTIINPVICDGQTYTLPWGNIISSSGIYKDTLRYTTGCDSLYRTVNLTVQTTFSSTFNPVICAGQTFTLPWGNIVSSSGTYKDTLRYTTGCDRLYRTVNLTVQAISSSTINSVICAGQTYTLPWGNIVSLSGIYKDTLRYTTGCDSLYRTVNLTVQSSSSTIINPVICAGQTYTLPWGYIVSSSGIYKDTLRYTTGCDSLYRTVNLTLQTASSTTINPVICAGQTFTLPWGNIVFSSGTYKDTLKYTTGCDSLYRIVNLTVQATSSTIINPVICFGQSYTLPWGNIVSSSGIYKDTLLYTTGCDSLYRTVNLTVQSAVSSPSINPVICAGQSYTLPWGVTVNSSGIYRDTLRYRNTGCDSVQRTVNLLVQPVNTVSSNITICQGQSYTLPWGTVVNISGVYKDTLFYRITNCDSVIRIVNLFVTPAAISSINASICSGDSYNLPWGMNVTTAGIYRDTARSSFGCDSLIRTVTLSVKPKPVVTISSSNDIDCMISISKLNATGGIKYLWSPTIGLSNPTINNPNATPAASTMYHVQVTAANDCTNEDSIRVNVITGVADNGFLMPSAFTPNGDGRNDCFGVKHWGNISNLKFIIYNRWGEVVFKTTDPSQCWDGVYKGEKQFTAVFVFQVWADTFCGKVYREGTVTVIR